MTYVPKLNEEEALLLILRVLKDEPKGQATVTEVKKRIEDGKLRPLSEKDTARSDTRPGEPVWHQIVRNAFNRLNKDRHFYRASFIRTVSESSPKVLKITDEGRTFVNNLNDFEYRLREEGFILYEYFDESILDDNETWKLLKEKLKKPSIKKDDLLRPLRSKEYAKKHYIKNENNDVYTKVSSVLKQLCKNPSDRSVDAWMAGRNYIGELANIESEEEHRIAERSRYFSGSTKQDF